MWPVGLAEIISLSCCSIIASKHYKLSPHLPLLDTFSKFHHGGACSPSLKCITDNEHTLPGAKNKSMICWGNSKLSTACPWSYLLSRSPPVRRPWLVSYPPPSQFCEHSSGSGLQLASAWLLLVSCSIPPSWYGRGHPANSHEHKSSFGGGRSRMRAGGNGRPQADCERVARGKASGIPVGRPTPYQVMRLWLSFQGCEPDIDTLGCGQMV